MTKFLPFVGALRTSPDLKEFLFNFVVTALRVESPFQNMLAQQRYLDAKYFIGSVGT